MTNFLVVELETQPGVFQVECTRKQTPNHVALESLHPLEKFRRAAKAQTRSSALSDQNLDLLYSCDLQSALFKLLPKNFRMKITNDLPDETSSWPLF